MLRISTPSSLAPPGPVTDAQAARTCTHAGVGLIQGKIATLQNVEKGIVATEAELTRSMEQKAVIDSVLLGLKWTKAACDSFIAIAAQFTGPKGGGVAGAYEATSTVAEAASRTATGQSVDWTRTTTRVATGSLKAAKGLAHMGKLPVSEVTKRNLDDISTVAGVGKVNVEIIHNAMKQDASGIKKGIVDLHVEVARLSMKLKGGPAEKAVNIAKELVDMTLTMYDNYEEFRQERAANRETLRAMKQTQSRLLASVRRQIRKLEQELQVCISTSAPQLLQD